MTICYVENLSTWKSLMWTNFFMWQTDFFPRVARGTRDKYQVCESIQLVHSHTPILPSAFSVMSQAKHSINYWHSIGLIMCLDESGHVSVLYWPKWGISVIYVATALLVKFKSQTFSSKLFHNYTLCSLLFAIEGKLLILKKKWDISTILRSYQHNLHEPGYNLHEPVGYQWYDQQLSDFNFQSVFSLDPSYRRGRVYKLKFCLFVCPYVITSLFPI